MALPHQTDLDSTIGADHKDEAELGDVVAPPNAPLWTEAEEKSAKRKWVEQEYLVEIY